VTDFGINMLWHPSLGMELGDNLQKMLRVRPETIHWNCRAFSASAG
jgi:hypothetical protein